MISALRPKKIWPTPSMQKSFSYLFRITHNPEKDDPFFPMPPPLRPCHLCGVIRYTCECLTNEGHYIYPCSLHSRAMLVTSILHLFVQVSPVHTVYWECSGNPTMGTPVMVLHGGPGGGSQADYRRYFDPSVYSIIQMDQRGCGKSTPHAELEDNNTQALVADIEKLREHLSVGKYNILPI